MKNITSDIANKLYSIPGRYFIALIVLAALLPFLDFRVLRMAGDEKVYLTQAIEMAREGRWFVQTLADEPNYFKGPLHYILVRIGMAVFGNRLIAGTWMNGAFALASALAVFSLIRRRWNEKSAVLLGIAMALNVGIVSHAFASQMEVEVAAFFTFAFVALAKSEEKPGFKYEALFWITAGMAGWSKSPLHSVLISLGGLIYWTWNGSLLQKLRTPRFWAAGFLGAFVGILGYLPAAIADFPNFYEFFILREQFAKANNSRAWHYPMMPLLHFALPWTFIVLAGFKRLPLLFASNGARNANSTIDIPLARIGLSMAIPSLLMWATWSYKGQNYNLPILPALLFFGWACFKGQPPRWTIRAAGALGLISGILLFAIVAHFSPLPAWWGTSWLVFALAGIAVFAACFLFSEDVRILSIGAAGFFIAFSSFITPLGEREMIGMQKFIKDHSRVKLHYYNLDPSIWSEWSLLQLSLHRPIYGVHKKHQLSEATKTGHAVVVQNRDWLNIVLNYWKKSYGTTSKPPVIVPWTRWLTKGTTSNGESRWRSAWIGKDLSLLEREFYIVYFP
jgi:4-amino-4-deoxy-L-arabinose transferase-like glycosyltransferase